MSSSTGAPPTGEKSFFEQQRELLLQEIGIVSLPPHQHRPELMGRKSFEHVLANINKLNRSLEGVIAVSFVLNTKGFRGD